MDAEITIVGRNVLEFVIFCMEGVAERLGKEPEDVLDVMRERGVQV